MGAVSDIYNAATQREGDKSPDPLAQARAEYSAQWGDLLDLRTLARNLGGVFGHATQAVLERSIENYFDRMRRLNNHFEVAVDQLRMTLDLDTLTLDSGSHEPDDGEGGVMEWVSVLAGEDWTDHPACTSPVIASFLRSWNDALPDDTRQDLKRFIPALPGTNKGRELDDRLAWMCTDWLVRVQAPAWLRLAGLTDQAEMLASMQELTAETTPSIMPVLKAVRSDAAAAWAAAGDAARAAARDALAPTKTELQASALELVDRLIITARAA